MKIRTAVSASLMVFLTALPLHAWKVVPLLSYSTSSGVLLGGVVNHNMFPPFEPFAFSTMGYVYTDGSVSAEPQLLLPSGDGLFRFSVNYLADRKNKFFGWGNEGSDETYEEYANEILEGSASYSFSPFGGYLLTAGLMGRHSTVYDRTGGDLWEQSPSEGYGSLWTAGPFIQGRWTIPALLDGYLTGAFDLQTGEDVTYSRTQASVAVFTPIGGSTLPGFRVKLGRHIGAGSTPFPFLPSLGGSSGLRGYNDGRFTGDWTLLVNAELRQRIFSLEIDESNRFDLSLVLFGDAGQAADHLDGFEWDRFHLDGGLGARMSLPGGGALRADFALSPEGLGIQMGLGELF
ncbi:MAG: hypothetical protein JXA64_07095 [Candidatus Fermentibacteraceae bacterium]|nr:hypothetical protein [Candidatus Fermentibacteraceae bacterium]